MPGRSLRYLTLAAALAGALWVAGTRAPAHGRPAPAAAAMAEVELRSRDIAFYERRSAEDPRSAADLARLAALYLQRGRETSSVEDFRLAEAAARRSLALRESRNGRTQLTLASALLAQHRFPEALAAAERLVAIEPEQPSCRALLGEIQLELGAYDAAAATFAALENHSENLAVAPRLARWAEIRGEPERARRILDAARRAAATSPGLPREQVAWFHLRFGDLALRHGRLREAESAFRAGLAVEPNDHRIFGALARLEAARGRWRRVVAYGERTGEAADLATLALIGDAHAALGRQDAAEEYYVRLERAAAANPEPFNRQWTQFRLDHDRHITETLALLRSEIGIRRDVLGYDLLAWALYKAGAVTEARVAMRQALRLGTRDALFFFHAGMIERALGDGRAARQFFRQALETNPRFHPVFARWARA